MRHHQIDKWCEPERHFSYDKKMLRPFFDKLSNSKTQILFHRNTTMTSTVN